MTIIPQPPAPQNPFSKHYDWKPSDYEVAAFEEKLSVIEDPFVVLDYLESGTLTRNHMESLKAVYPGIHSMMQRKVTEEAAAAPVPIPYQQRMKLSLLLETPLDPSIGRVAQYQQSFLIENEQEQQGFGTGAQIDLAGQMMTDTQKINDKG